ncbi:MAG: hypothetical protein ACJ8H8_06565 [Geminicoccaceae bacterium]
MERRYFRSFLFLLTLFPLSVGRQVLAKVPQRDFASLFGEVTSDYSTIDRLGSAYLAVVDEHRLAATLRRLRDKTPTRIAELRAAIAELAQEDLARHDTVLVDGWVLARAEAEALALIHIAKRS